MATRKKTEGKQPAFPVPANAVAQGQTIAQVSAFRLAGDILAGPYGATIMESRSRDVLVHAADTAIDLLEVVQARLVARGYA